MIPRKELRDGQLSNALIFFTASNAKYRRRDTNKNVLFRKNRSLQGKIIFR
jgi:hypothetical protein